MPTNIHIRDDEIKRDYDISGEGGSIDLQIAGTFDTEHPFALNTDLENEDLAKLILTYKNIDKKTFFTIPNQYKNIDDLIKELEKRDDLKWPCASEKELCVNRKCSTRLPTAPLCKFSNSRSLSCAMKLDVIPSCLFINSLVCDLTLVDVANEEECFIESNHTAVPKAVTVSQKTQTQCPCPFRFHFVIIIFFLSIARLRIES